MSNKILFSILLLFLFSPTNLFSSQIWLEPKDELLVKKLEFHSNTLNHSVDSTSYPISRAKLKTTSSDKLLEIFSSRNSFQNKFSINYSNNIFSIRNISDTNRYEKSVSLERTFENNSTAGKLSVIKNISSNSEDEYLFSGTHLSTIIGNSVLGIGFIERWWGPGNDNSLILSNYSDPQPGIYLESLSGFRFKNFMSFIGKVNYSFFVNFLDDERFINNTNLIGARITIQPNKNLTLGFSRVTMFGGDNRPDSFESFVDNLFRLTRTENGVDLSNEIAGYDLKYNFNINKILISSYFQLIGEDEIKFTPSTKIFTYGNEIIFLKNGLLRSIGIEYSNTIADFGDRYNVTYEHGSYKSGYRYKNLPLGAFIDGDSIFLKLTTNVEVNEKFFINFSLFRGEFNKDNVGVTNVWGITNEDYEGTKLKIGYSLDKNFNFELGVLAINENLYFNSKEMDKITFNIGLNYNF